MKQRYAGLLGNQHAKGNKPNTTSFRKGHQPWNKGVKGLHLSPETESKKGQKGIKWVPIGIETNRTDKKKTKRWWIKVAEPNKWIHKCDFVWIKANGNIPKGFFLHHSDGNALNDDIENLALVTRPAHINLHRKDLLKGMAEQLRKERGIK